MLLLAALALTTTALTANAQEIWRIGEFDNSYDEFACARHYSAYAATFPNDATYRVGSSSPARDWPYVNPGPGDPWAGARVHRSTIEFALPVAPASPLRLTADLVGVQGGVPTSMGLKVNDAEGVFRLQNGPEASVNDPAAGREQVVSVLLSPSRFRAGTNTITLWSTGSWFVYDAISLTAEPGASGAPVIRNLSVEPTIFLKRMPDGRLGQAVIARINVDGQPDGVEFAVRSGSTLQTVPVATGIVFGTVEQELLVPEVEKPTPVVVEARSGSTVLRAEATIKPERRWTIFVAPSVHTDIGYTDLQSKVVERHDENTDRAIALCEKYPAFGWNLEAAWQADNYRADRPLRQTEKLYQLARQGRIGVQASYLNMLTGLCSHEELNRWLYYAHSLKSRHGVPFESALTTDVPTQTWSIPSTLAAAGIRYFATGINTTRGYTFTKLMSGYPYWWEGPDGSRVLAYFAPGYAHAGGPMESVNSLKGWILGATANRADFPYDALFMYGAIGDNGTITDTLATTAQQWADAYEYPKVVVGPNSDYFRYMEAKYGDQLPVVRGDGGYYWEDGAASSAYETTLNRRAHETMAAADALSALAHVTGTRPSEGRSSDQVWKDILLYDEHTWGAWCSISSPDDTQTVEQWKVKSAFATDAARGSDGQLLVGKSYLGSHVTAGGPSVVLYNATGWDREPGVADLGLDAPGNRATPLLDPATGDELPACTLESPAGSRRLLTRIPRIPAWGYVVCPLGTGDVSGATGVPITGTPTLENARLRIAFDRETGGISSLVDKDTGRELVDQTADTKLNEYLYVTGGDGTNIVDIAANKPADLTIHRSKAPRFVKQDLGGLGQAMRIEAGCAPGQSVVSTVTLLADADRVDIENAVTHTRTRSKEAAYFAFPFAASNPEVRLEIPNGVMRPEGDQLPGACKEWFSMQHFARIVGREGSIAWASPDAPLVCVGDINRGLWPEKLDIRNGHLYSYVMNNYWFTNYKADQASPLPFRYSITTEARTDAEAARFGWQASMPVYRVAIGGAQTGPLPGGSASICSVNRPGVMITAVKPPERGPGMVVRLFSLESRPVHVRLTAAFPGMQTALLCNLVEEPQSALPVRNGVVTVPVRPMAPTTVMLR